MGIVFVVFTPLISFASYKAAEKVYNEIYNQKSLLTDKAISKIKEIGGVLPEIGDVQESQNSANNTSNSKKSTSKNTEDSNSGNNTNSSSNNSNSDSESSSSDDSGDNSNSNSSSFSDSSNGSSSDSSDDSSSLPSCGSNYSFFTSSPVSLSNLDYIVPLGNLNPSGHTFPTDHVYPQIVNSATVPLYSPGNVTITQISAVDNYSSSTTDYSIYFKPCNEVEVYYLHVKTISTKLSNELVEPFGWDSTYSTGGTTYRNRGKNMSLAISAGEQIGTASSFDIGTRDTRTTLNFANSERWTSYGYDHTVCPLDYYSSSLKSSLKSLLMGWSKTPRTVEPICGTVEQDIASTAQGAWFVSGTSNSWGGEDQHLALVHDNIDPTQAIFSIGTSMSASELSNGTYGFYPTGLEPEYVNRDFSEVTANGHIYCYRPMYLSGRIILELTNSTTIKIERQDGNCDSPPWSFTGNATTFER